MLEAITRSSTRWSLKWSDVFRFCRTTVMQLTLWRYCDGNSDNRTHRRYSCIKNHQKTLEKPRWLQRVLIWIVKHLSVFGLWIPRSNHLSYPAMFWINNLQTLWALSKINLWRNLITTFDAYSVNHPLEKNRFCWMFWRIELACYRARDFCSHGP